MLENSLVEDFDDSSGVGETSSFTIRVVNDVYSEFSTFVELKQQEE